MTRIYYKDDFKILFRFISSDGVDKGKIPECDFKITLSSGWNAYEAGRKNGKLYNCTGISENILAVLCDDHGLTDCKELKADITYHIPDRDMPDGGRSISRSIDTGITLSALPVSESDQDGPGIIVTLPYIVVSSGNSTGIVKHVRGGTSDGVIGRVIHRGIMPLYAQPNVYYRIGDGSLFALPKGIGQLLKKGINMKIRIPEFLKGKKFVIGGDRYIQFGYPRWFDYKWLDDNTIEIQGIIDFDPNQRIILNTEPLECRSGDGIRWIDKDNVLRYDKRNPLDHYPEGTINLESITQWIYECNHGDRRPAPAGSRGARFVFIKRRSMSERPWPGLIDKGEEAVDEWLANRSKRFWGKKTNIRMESGGVFRVYYQSGKRRYRSKSVLISVKNGSIKEIG